jgi:AcrR family transcriptional regulator
VTQEPPAAAHPDPQVSLGAQAAPRRRMPAAERRAAILDAARGAFARAGFHGASTAEIARAAACSEPILYRHFASKQALFAAVLEDAAMRLREATEAGMYAEPDDPFGALVHAGERLAGDPRLTEVLRLRGLAVTMLDDPVVRETVERMASTMRGRVEAAVRRSQATGRIRADVPPEQIAQLWAGLSFLAGFAYAVEGPDATVALAPARAALLDLLRPTPRTPEGPA